MDIRINGKPADITLESEKKVGDVLAGIENWLEGSLFFISGLELDGKMYGSSSLDAVFDMPLEEIASINVKTSGWAELMLEALLGLKDDLEFYETLDEAGRDENRQRWEKSATALFLKSNAPELFNLVIKTLEGNFPVSGTLSLVSERIREIEDPSRELAGSQTLIEEVAKRLEELPLDIQTGKDGRAAETISVFSTLAEKVFRLIFLFKHFGAPLETIEVPVPDGCLNLKDYIDEFSTALKELASAYENNDTVLVGDLAEYELSPRLLCLAGILGGIDLGVIHRKEGLQ
ncbi:MAG: hypothetical protein LBB72_03805 [Spirochaetaceae bacterium]|jgi:hypothetical protein|nr:hypothetical protein [Spirochaetaceae bacterium]